MSYAAHGTEVLTYNQLISALKKPGVWSKNLTLAQNPTAARIRAGGLHHIDQLPQSERDDVEFREALCIGISRLAATLRKLTAASLDVLKHRRKIHEIASQIYTKHKIDFGVRGGKISAAAKMPKGRTLLLYYRRYVESGYDPMALASQTWLQGNRTRRISTTIIDLIFQAIEQIWLEGRKRSVAAVHKRFTLLLDGENVAREANGLLPINGVSYQTVHAAVSSIPLTATSVARDGIRHAVNAFTRGSTDTRALMLGEYVEVDECKLSLITAAKKCHWYANLSEKDRALLEEVDEIIHSRLHLVLIIDVASRMPLGWVLSETPGAEATQAALRMAMRDKTKEKIRYGCERNPMPAIGIGMLKGDNGSGIRNSPVKTSALGLNTHTVDARTYRGGDKPYIERMFGTMESQLIAMLHGYAGRRPGDLTGYDPIRNGALDCEALYGIITRYLIDEYPLQRHTGTTMLNRRPIEAAKQINEEYGAILPPTAHDFRIHLGFRHECKITHEGVKAFGLPFNSADLQKLGETLRGKVTVFVDPDNIAFATVLSPRHPEPVLVELQWTAMQDLTLKEFFIYAEHARAEDPMLTRDFEQTISRTRQKLQNQMDEIAAKHKLPRSYLTVEEATRKGNQILAGVHSTRKTPEIGAAEPGTLNQMTMDQGQYVIGNGFEAPLDGEQTSIENDPFAITPDTKGKLT
ncbi:hypothetical protein [Thioclava kandeliae]|uniref:Integrase catalytic domain-containing protein n=1 Tax=Thioclava kandeliae TaxID=3070818 RepID=A0ABV1SIT1_9RHOB